jgi:hypothetical protein
VSAPVPPDADSAAALAAAGQRNAGVYVTPGGTQDLQTAQLGGAEPDPEPGREGGQP